MLVSGAFFHGIQTTKKLLRVQQLFVQVKVITDY